VSIYYLSDSRDIAFAMTGNSFVHILHDLHMLMAKAALTASCRFPAATSFCWLSNRPEPLSSLLFESSFSGLRFPQIMKLD
jgi:hypothetical protein